MNGFTILIVEDDRLIGDLLQKILQREGYQVFWKTNGSDIWTELRQADLVIMDIMLPGEDGYQLTQKIKSAGFTLPVLFLSALQDIDSRLQGLTLGEDYLVKPFDPRELLLRMQKMLNHAYGTFVQIYHLFVDAERRKVFNQQIDQEISFTAIERKIFFYLYDHKDRILTKEQFFAYLWPLDDRNPNIINVHIKKLRSKIEDTQGTIIQNVYGEGYRLNTRVKI
ncbi:response regulator transcription factor [Domibacillus robiginosus]|uniref:response regulator transcription factor n=1 Tax=Domibacillus robiginosus TaxID=1071054 RepID=UPI00067E6316|nr:response regulator transcription factor [Domibacillus robiginosus]